MVFVLLLLKVFEGREMFECVKVCVCSVNGGVCSVNVCWFNYMNYWIPKMPDVKLIRAIDNTGPRDL